jgi:hypothetical protein
LPKAFLCLVMACFSLLKGCDSSAVNRALPPHHPAPLPTLLAVYMPWFGDHTHMDVGYSSHDTGVLHKQIEQAKHIGISAFVVDWYGESAPYSDANFALLQKVASKSHFQVALLYNEPEDADQQSTDDAIAGLDKAYNSYIGPSAKYHDAYFTYQGHPVIFIFPKQGHVDWNHVREHCGSWSATPIFIYKDEPPAQYAADFAGSYAWVQPGAAGWSPDGSNWGEQYLEYFYKTMHDKRPDKIAVGGVWPGFDDSGAKWGLNRHMQRNCGKTFDTTLHMYDRYFDSATPLPFLLIETWNDYEEGTAIERGITGSGCAAEQGDANPLTRH